MLYMGVPGSKLSMRVALCVFFSLVRQCVIQMIITSRTTTIIISSNVSFKSLSEISDCGCCFSIGWLFCRWTLTIILIIMDVIFIINPYR